MFLEQIPHKSVIIQFPVILLRSCLMNYHSIGLSRKVLLHVHVAFISDNSSFLKENLKIHLHKVPYYCACIHIPQVYTHEIAQEV